MIKRASHLLFASLGIAALGAPAHAAPNELTLGSSFRALHSPSANAVTETGLDGAALGYGRRLPLELHPDLALWGVAGAQFGGAEGTMFQTLSTHVETSAFTLGARARYTIHPRISGSVRLDLGTMRTAFSLRDSAGHSASDSGWAPVTSASAGLDLLAIAHPTFSLGVRFELGHVAASAVTLTARSERVDEDTIELPMTQTALGDLDLGGRFVTVSVISQF